MRSPSPMLCDRAGIEHGPSSTARYESLEDCFYEAYAAEFARYRRAGRGRRATASPSGATACGRPPTPCSAFSPRTSASPTSRVVEVRRAGERSALLIGEGIEELIDLLDEGRAQPGAPADLTRATAESVAGRPLQPALPGGCPRRRAARESEIVPQAMYTAVLPYLGVQVAMEELSIPPPPDPRRCPTRGRRSTAP